jgi:hypothetical protein
LSLKRSPQHVGKIKGRAVADPALDALLIFNLHILIDQNCLDTTLKYMAGRSVSAVLFLRIHQLELTHALKTDLHPVFQSQNDSGYSSGNIGITQPMVAFYHHLHRDTRTMV